MKNMLLARSALIFSPTFIRLITLAILAVTLLVGAADPQAAFACDPGTGGCGG